MYKYLGSTNILMYNLFNYISFVALFAFNLMHLKIKKQFLSNCSQLLIKIFSEKAKFKFLSNTTIWAVLEIFIISALQYGIARSLTLAFGDLVNTSANYFGVLFSEPFILLLLFFLISINPLKQTDIIVPAYPLALFFSKLACFCDGCCGGFEWSHGLYNFKTEHLEFPIQLVESGIALLIFIFLLFWRKKAKEGTLFPIYLIIYSATRFFSEFLSNKPDVIWILKTYHILCIVGVIIGIVELIIVFKYADKLRSLCSEFSLLSLIKKGREKIKFKEPQKKRKNKSSKKKLYQKYR